MTCQPPQDRILPDGVEAILLQILDAGYRHIGGDHVPWHNLVQGSCRESGEILTLLHQSLLYGWYRKGSIVLAYPNVDSHTCVGATSCRSTP